MVYRVQTGVEHELKKKIMAALLTLALTIGVPAIGALMNNDLLPLPASPWVLSESSEIAQAPSTTTSTTPSTTSDSEATSTPATTAATFLHNNATSVSNPGSPTVVPDSTSAAPPEGGRGGNETPPPDDGSEDPGDNPCICDDIPDLPPDLPPIDPSPSPPPIQLLLQVEAGEENILEVQGTTNPDQPTDTTLTVDLL